MKWTGILIEADRKSFNVLMSRKRKSYALSVCLSLEPYPTQVFLKTYTQSSDLKYNNCCLKRR